MANNPEPIEVSIIAKIQGLLDGLGTATSAVKSGTDQMTGALGGLEKMISNLKAPFLAFTGILAGGAMFKGAVDATVSWNGEVIKLARTLGISTEEASALNVALGDIYTDASTYTGAVQKLSMQVNNGGEGFKKLGINIKDSNGQLKPSTQLMTEVLTKLNGMKEGTDRNAAGVAIFGRSWGEAQKLLKLNAQVMEEAKQKAEKLNLIVGGDSVEAQKKYKAAMNDVDDVLTGIKLVVGRQLLPVLADLGNWFADVAPAVIPVVAVLIKGLTHLFYDLALGVQVVWNLLRALWETGDAVANGLSRAFTAIVHGSWGDLKNSFAGVGDAIAKSWSNAMDRMYDDATKTNTKIEKLWSPTTPTKNTRVGKAGSEGFDATKGKDNSEEVLRAFKLELEKKKESEDNWFTWSTARELEFWQGKRGQVDAGSKAYVAILTEENKLKRKLAEENQAKEKADFDLRVAKAREGSQERVTLAQQEAGRLAAVYGLDSKQFKDALVVVEKAKEAHADKMRQVDMLVEENARDAQLAILDEERAIMQDEASMGLISQKQRIAAELAYENQVYQIKLEAARKAAELEPDPVKRQGLLNQMAQLERQHNAQVSQINRQATQERWGQWKGFFDSMTGGFSSAVRGLIRGTMEWGTALMTVLDQALDGVINFFVQWGLQAATTALANQAVGAASRAAEGAGYAALWAVNAASSAAAIPVVGWAMAPGVAAEAYAQGMGWASLASAAGGWDRVPRDQMAAIHKDEMVLSSPLATKIRNMADGGQGRGGDTYEAHFHGVTDASWWKANQGNIIRTVADGFKNRRTR